MAGLTASQLRDLGHAASNYVAGWYLKEIGDQYKDIENKENEPGKRYPTWLKQKDASKQGSGYEHSMANIHPVSGGAPLSD